MGKNKFTRVLALCLAVVCLVSVASALSFDLNGDGKTNVWDLQLAVNQGKTEDYAAALEEALGGKDELSINTGGAYEIWSPLGLYNMARMVDEGKDKGVTFKLMADIDLKGAAWDALILSGTLEGNGHVISNVVVKDDATINTSGTVAQGFFAKINRGALVTNLKLENITVAVPENSKATFVGLMTGSLTGEIHDCTTVGTVIDPRTNLTSTCYYGTLAGRVENVTDNPVIGITMDDESILMTAETAEVTAISGKSQKVLCKMAMDFAVLESGSKGRSLGIAGWAPDYTNFKKYNWQDISGACIVEGGTGKTYNLEDPILTARRQATVDKMYEICTVEWTPSEDMVQVYYKTSGGKLDFSYRVWEAGTTYYGMPYNHGSGSLERFYAYMDTNAKGVLTPNDSVPAYAFYYTYSGALSAMNTDGINAKVADSNFPYWKQGDVTKSLIDAGLLTGDRKWNLTNGTYYENIVHLLGAGYDSAFVGEELLSGTVQGSDHAGFSRYLGNDCSQAIQWAWREVVSSDVKTGGTVISGVRQMAPTVDYQNRFGVLPVGGLEPDAYSAAASCKMYDEAGKTGFYNAYAQASRGDAIIEADSGHSRMIAYDPICIRDYKGNISETNSYLITHEQGGTAKNNYTSCHWDRVLTFSALVNGSNSNHASDGSGACRHYYPMTIPAFHDVDNAAVTSNVTYKNGVVKSNFYILSTTVDGNEKFTAICQNNGVKDTGTNKSETLVGPGYREAQLEINVLTDHGLESLEGKTVTVRLSNGDIYTVNTATGAVTKAN